MAKGAEWLVVGRYRDWVGDATISESVERNGTLDRVPLRRFTATIDGWGGFMVYEGEMGGGVVDRVKRRVRLIQERIRAGDELVFKESEPGACSEVLAALMSECNVEARRGKYLVGVKKQLGWFIVRNGRMNLDRAAYRVIAAEAKENGVRKPYFVYCRIVTYSGPGMVIHQLGI